MVLFFYFLNYHTDNLRITVYFIHINCPCTFVEPMFMSMGWDYVFEMQPPAGPLFIPKMIYEV
jgi:hypothetical protein